MLNFSDQQFKRIALNLITYKNQKVRGNLKTGNITIDALFSMDATSMIHLGLTRKEIHDLQKNHQKIAEDEIQRITDNNIEVIFKEEELYPALLKEIYDPPDYIYLIGDKSILTTKKIAVVGSRKGSSYGSYSINKIIPELSKAGLTVVSGMAYGVDSMAHRTAIKENGKTIGVNAGGLLRPYPAGNRNLFTKISENGCVISDFPLDVIPRPFHFPIRNRIIAGISTAVLIVEAAYKSGSLITAKLALEQNRDIFAIPGRIDSPLNQGTNYLIQQGAKLIISAHDILCEYGLKPSRKHKNLNSDLTEKEKKILDLMVGNEVKNIDYFAERLEYSTSEIISLLMGLILKNLICEQAGGYIRLT